MLPGTGSSKMHSIPFQSPDNCRMSQPENLDAQELLWSNNVEMPAICDESSTANPTTIKKTQASAQKKVGRDVNLNFQRGRKKQNSLLLEFRKCFWKADPWLKN